jgi:Holliday junction resolvase
MANINIGNEYEKEFLLLLTSYNYWAYRTPNAIGGQPCDIIAMNGKKNWLIDVKHSKSDKFLLSRCEGNQKTTFTYATKYCNIKNCGFAIYFESIKKFKWLAFGDIDFAKYKSVDFADMQDFEEILTEVINV